jgi:hypothetical protein
MTGSRTTESVLLGDTTVLVWLVDRDGDPVSNRVPLDDPGTLERQLEKPSAKTSDRPRELDAGDLENPVAQILARLHSDFIFDIDELDSIKQAERATGDDAADVERSDVWERLAREELALDPRATAYRRLGDRAPFEGEELLLLLRMMLDRAPEERSRRLGSSEGEEGSEDEHGFGKKWTVTQRLQVRLMNVLTRWGRALADPRMNWLHPLASVRNFQALIYAIGELWELDALPEKKLEHVVGLVFGSFVRSEEANGYLFQLTDDERGAAVRRVSKEGRIVATTLTYLGLRPRSDWEEHVFAWQAWLRPCMETGVVRATKEAAEFASRLSGEEVTAASLGARLAWASDYIDDPRWCLEMKRACGLDDVRFSNARFSVELVLEVRAQDDLVDDPGVVRLIRNALEFRRANGVVVMSGGERISVRLGEKAVARLKDRQVLESENPITDRDLAILERGGLPLREHLVSSEELAAS